MFNTHPYGLLQHHYTAITHSPAPRYYSEPQKALYWLSGLTCDDTNFIFKAGAQRQLAKEGLAVVCPDTSPRMLC